jgi:hypothetical protein
MRNITVILLALLTASLSMKVNASFPEKPNRCPSMGFVRAIGFDVAENKGGSNWIAKKFDSAYDTNAGWEFSLSVKASSQAEAIKNAKSTLQLISVLEGPTMTADRAHWTCNAKVQTSDYVYIAKAITPW